jgi:hypothetical protein
MKMLSIVLLSVLAMLLMSGCDLAPQIFRPAPLARLTAAIDRFDDQPTATNAGIVKREFALLDAQIAELGLRTAGSSIAERAAIERRVDWLRRYTAAEHLRFARARAGARTHRMGAAAQ